jgi:uncharacterized protein (DUF2249 family)/hemerythrin-like domain-containing protein
MPIQLGTIAEHGFDEPLALLSDCHRRIERFLEILRVVVKQAGDGALNDEQRRAVETSLKYFREAAPRHTEDEEQSLFPRLRASSHPAAMAALEAMAALHEDHEAATAAHDQVEKLYRQWLDTGSLDAQGRQTLVATLNELSDLYRPHIALEDSQLFPMASKALSEEQIAGIGQEMAARRNISFRRDLPASSNTLQIKSTIDVRPIPGPQRHPLIFKTFDSLAPGDALELVNDHNPIPLRNQFKMLRAGKFSWDYLQEGPELFRVRIGKIRA